MDTNTGTTLDEGAITTITNANLAFSDLEGEPITVELVSNVANGVLFLDTNNNDVVDAGEALNVNDTFTPASINANQLKYSHDGSETTADSFLFTLTDGTSTSSAITYSFSINPVNDLPTIDVNTGDTVNEDGLAVIDNTELSSSDIEGGPVLAGWYDPAWQYRNQITISAANVDADLTDFSLLLTEAGLGADFWNNVNNDGSDIVITMGDGETILDRELVSIDTIGQTLQLYIRTDLSASADTEIFIYYGNAGASESNAATTWRSEYTGVWHFENDFSGGTVSDSSQNNLSSTSGNGFGAGNQVAGQTGNAADFNNTEFIAINHSFSGNNTLPAISVSAWVNTSFSGGGNDNWAIIDYDRSEFFNLFVDGSGQVGFATTAAGGGTHDFYSGAGNIVNDGNWHHVAAVYDGTDKIIYINGIEVARDTNTYGGAALGTNNTRFAIIADGSEANSFNGGRNDLYYDGLIDNLRLYEGVTSDAWITAEFDNQNDPGSFYTVGAQQEYAGGIEYEITAVPANGTLFLDANSNNIAEAGEVLNAGDRFTQIQIDEGRLKYQHDGENATETFQFFVTDGTDDTSVQTFTINVNLVNDAPVLGGDLSLNVNEDQRVQITAADLTAVDPDDANAEITFSVTATTNGTVTDAAGNVITSFTLADLLAGNVYFEHDGNEMLTSAGFDFDMDDGDEDGSGAISNTVNVAVTLINDTPVIDANTGAALGQGQTVTIDNTMLAASDVDGGPLAGWYDNSWSFRQQISIDPAHINADLTDFTLLLTEANFGADFWSNVNNNGSDIVITSADGTTRLSRELVSIDTVAQTMELHVRVPMVFSAAATDLYIYYGNAAGAETNNASAWNSDYIGVYHLNEASANAQDSSNPAYNGTAEGDTTGGAVGAIGNSVQFDGSGDRVNLGDIDDVELGQVSFSFWAQFNNLNQDEGFVYKGSHGTNQPILIWRDDSVGSGADSGNQNALSVLVYDGSTQDWYSTPSNSLNDTGWHHITVTLDPVVSNEMNIYIDGVLLRTGAMASNGIQANANDLLIGAHNGAGVQNLDGRMDEFRIASTIFSQEWVQAEYANHSNPVNFYLVGAQELNVGIGLTYEVASEVVSGTLFLDANANGVADAGEHLGLNDTFTQTDIDGNLLKYTHSGSGAPSDIFSFSVSDGDVSTAIQNFTFAINIPNSGGGFFFIGPDAGTGGGGAGTAQPINASGFGAAGYIEPERIIFEEVTGFISDLEAQSLTRQENIIQEITILGSLTEGPALFTFNADSDNENSRQSENPHFTNLREALAFLQDMEEAHIVTVPAADVGTENEAGSEKLFTKTARQFEDVLTYHQKRQAELRAALMS